MSHAARSASDTGFPSAAVSANAGVAQATASRTAQALLSVDMLDLPAALDPPTRDAVEVLVGEGEDRRRLLGLAAQRHELRAGRLHIAGLVPGAALQHHRLAVPAPWHAEAREGLGQHRRLQRSLAKAFAAVGR